MTTDLKNLLPKHVITLLKDSTHLLKNPGLQKDTFVKVRTSAEQAIL